MANFFRSKKLDKFSVYWGGDGKYIPWVDDKYHC
jgi:hypothetical protein